MAVWKAALSALPMADLKVVLLVAYSVEKKVDEKVLLTVVSLVALSADFLVVVMVAKKAQRLAVSMAA